MTYDFERLETLLFSPIDQTGMQIRISIVVKRPIPCFRLTETWLSDLTKDSVDISGLSFQSLY